MIAIGPTNIPGITNNDALDANDQCGSLLTLAVPESGFIEKCLLIDPADQGAAAKFWFFNDSVTPAASDAAFALTDADLAKCIGALASGTYLDATNGQVAPMATVPFPYVAPNGLLYVLMQTTGTPTYLTASMPAIYLEITPA